VYSGGEHLAIWSLLYVYAGADPGFVGPEAYTIFRALLGKKNTELRTKVNIYLGPSQCLGRGPYNLGALQI